MACNLLPLTKDGPVDTPRASGCLSHSYCGQRVSFRTSLTTASRTISEELVLPYKKPPAAARVRPGFTPTKPVAAARRTRRFQPAPLLTPPARRVVRS